LPAPAVGAAPHDIYSSYCCNFGLFNKSAPYLFQFFLPVVENHHYYSVYCMNMVDS
jgi:hypothetical protein